MTRICNTCGKSMVEGFCIFGGEKYYCSKQCLKEQMTWEEYLELYEPGGDTYWTVWEDEYEKFIIAEAMNKYGGSFVMSLSRALLSADPINTQKIKTTWPELWEQYLEMGKNIVKRQEK